MTFDAALSGLQAATSNLDVIGNNIANSSTIGFKGSRANFGDIYAFGGYGSFGSGSTSIGGGVMLTEVQQSFASGNLTNSTNSLDLAVNGSGFFILNNPGGGALYTRAGQFKLDNQNYITNANGQYLTGLLADGQGNITGTSGNLQISTENITPQATTMVTTGVNLNSQSTPPAIDWVGGASPLSSSYNNPTAMTIYDSLGNSHVLSMFFIKADSAAAAGQPNASTPAGTENQWYVAFQIDNQNVPTNAGTDNTTNLYEVNFNSDGSFAGVASPGGVPIGNNLIPLSLNLNNGANPLSLNIDLSDSTQFGSPFSVQSSAPNGYTTGSLASLSIDDTGLILGIYTNGQSMAMGQIQLANFADPTGLQNMGNVCWGETSTSGQPLIGVATTGGLGQIRSGMLEQSNVDLTSELVDLISAQRDFQANAQSIRAGDTITQTIINIR
ncbi:flagellar hook protein FlgE [Legionella qingyii]|uniref:Flagellar hook protein FlgE n=1 Tax=Legionella qingyii TaxID=2184757 RepID=A0A317U4B5_9GAMM|nr:flagellar hook protein FlgE [Legionella qingyii]PWY55616.1 flagellar hook protein FlgE [Legionella qingyii]RUR21789.1 flagellar hook protein FlgE [Legionella qingyii]RUR25283.1 flagellar hook protein FlgE [Legionella qingyii]